MRVGVAFPRPLPVALGNLGYQTVTALFSSFPGLTVFRACPGDRRTPAPTVGRYLATVEGRLRLRDLDILAVSIPYENDYPEVYRLLTAGGIPPLARERGDGDPLVLLGGIAVTLNPEPTAEIADLTAIGEAEAILPELVPIFESLAAGRLTRRGALEEAATVEGVFVPTIHRPDPARPPVHRPKRRLMTDLDQRVAASAFLDPDSPFGDRFLLEAARGCPRRCRFCTVRAAYHPVRRRSGETLLAALPPLEVTRRVGLIGPSLSDMPGFVPLLDALVSSGRDVSTSSLRIESLSGEVLAALRRAGMRTLTIAPETGSPRLREIIGKPVPEEDLMRVTREAVEAGFTTIKVYLMIGLPGEEEADIKASSEMIRAMREAATAPEAARGEPVSIAVSAGAFVPKPWTPLQWEAMTMRKTLEARLRILGLPLWKLPGVSFSSELPKWAEVEGYLSRAGRGITPLIAAVAGGLPWPRALREHAALLPPIHEAWELDRELPWESVDLTLPREALETEAREVRRLVAEKRR